MSKALPMDAAVRGEHYASHPDRFTGRQSRRLAHKEGRENHGYYEPVPVDIPPAERPKGRPTPRRADAIGIRRSARRAKELFRVVSRG